MGEFDKDWLSLREPADHLARDTDLLQSLLEHLRAASDATTSTGSDMDHARSLSVVDLGTGTGSNLRYLQPRLGAHQRWQLVDNDPALLQVLPERLNAWAADQQLALFDNHSRIDGTAAQGHANSFLIDVISLDLATANPDVSEADLLTASALLDLFSAQRIDAIAEAAARASVPCLFALSYDGRIRCTPEHADDDHVFGLVNAHQQRDKGLGSALGPEGGAYMATALEKAGFAVSTRRADWQLDSSTNALQRELMNGWCQAAIEQSPSDLPRVRSWQHTRQQQIDSDELHITVGHIDVLGLPLP